MSKATDSDCVDADCDADGGSDSDACYALCGYVMRAPPSPQMAFQLPLHALPCLALDGHMHAAPRTPHMHTPPAAIHLNR